MRIINAFPSLLLLVSGANAIGSDGFFNETEEMVGKAPPIKGRYIVLLDEDKLQGSRLSQELRATTMTRDVGVTLGFTYTRLISGFSIKDASESAVAKLKKHELVKEVVPDAVVSKHDIQTEDLPWGLDRIDDDYGLDGSFEYPANAGEGTHIYILDTGIRIDHKEFEGRIAPDGENANFVDWSTYEPTPPWNDCDGHGTHVASTAVGTNYGVAKKATVHAFRVLDCSGWGYASTVASALGMVVEQCSGDEGRLCVVNLSLGFWRSSDIQILNRAANAVVESGVTLVTSAGNDGSSSCYKSPASAEKAITVGSTYIYRYNPGDDSRSSFSNYGECLDIFAPGSYILGASYSCSTCSRTLSGTSMASPLVAGVAAVILQDFKKQGRSTAPEAVLARLQAEALVDVIVGAGYGSPNLLLQMTSLFVSHPPSLAPTSTSAPSDAESNSPSSLPTSSLIPSTEPSGRPSTPPSEEPTTLRSEEPSSAPTGLSCAPWLQKILIFIQTDHNADETSFVLTNTCEGGGKLLDVSRDDLDDYTAYSWVQCVGFGRFDFTKNDSGGDGIIYPGYYQVTFDDEVVARSFYFDDSEQVIFGDDDCITPAPTVSHPPSLAPTVTTQPTTTGFPSPGPSDVISEFPSASPSEFFCEDSSYLLIELYTDYNAHQISFEVVNFCEGGKVLSVEEETLEDRERYNYQLCIGRGMHMFIIRDSGNNGLYYPGYFKITLNDQVLVNDPYYSKRYEKSFGKDCLCRGGQKFFALEIEPDQYAEETSFEVETCDGTQLIGVNPGEFDEETYYHYPMCLDPDGHIVTVHDTYGDGIVSPGYFRVTYDGNQIAYRPDFDWTYELPIGPTCSVSPTPGPTNVIPPTRIPSTTVSSGHPTIVPSSESSAEAEKAPSEVPSSHPTVSLMPSSPSSPSPGPSTHPPTPTVPPGHPTIVPSSEPTAEAEKAPSEVPSSDPTVSLMPSSPSPGPSTRPPSPTVPPGHPTIVPSSEPTAEAEKAPSEVPSSDPTRSAMPSSGPSTRPSSSLQPTYVRSSAATETPSGIPSATPSTRPTAETEKAPSEAPSSEPTGSIIPSLRPTTVPSEVPSSEPTEFPSLRPTAESEKAPSEVPSSQPTSTSFPSLSPSGTPSGLPTRNPSHHPTWFPSQEPTSASSEVPTNTPSDHPTLRPTVFPSLQPTIFPSLQPTSPPSNIPSRAPSDQPSITQSMFPTVAPSESPTRAPVDPVPPCPCNQRRRALRLACRLRQPRLCMV